MNIILDDTVIHNLDDRKKTLFKYFNYSQANIVKIDFYQNSENYFLIYNSNIKDSIALLQLNRINKHNSFIDFEIKEISFQSTNSLFTDNNKNNNDNHDINIPTYKIIGEYYHLEKLYIINSIYSIFIIDLRSSSNNRFYKMKIDPEDIDDNIDIGDYTAFAIIEPKIIFTGGINKEKKINKNLFSFDITTYRFELNKIRENNFIGRYRHGIVSDNSYIYAVGGFTKYLTEEEIGEINQNNSSKYICEKIQVIKFDNMMETYMELEFNGLPPKLIIDPYIQNINGRFIFAFSNFIYEKIWYLDIISNNSNEINLSYLTIPKNLITYNGFYYSKEENCFIAICPVYNNKNRLIQDKEGFVNSFEVEIAENENEFELTVKYLNIEEVSAILNRKN